MVPLQPQTNPVGSSSTDVSLGNTIPAFTAKDIFVTRKHNRILNVVNSLLRLRLQRGPSDDIFLSKGGLTIQIASTGQDSNPSPPFQASRFILVSCPSVIDGNQHIPNGDYIVCRPVGGADDGSQDVTIAKAYKMRPSLTGVVEMGITYTFTYQATSDSNNPQRTKTSGSLSEIEMIIPVWTPMTGIDQTTGDQILAIPADTGVVDFRGNPVVWEMVHSRPWAKIGTGS